MVDRSIIGADPAFCVEDIQKAILLVACWGSSCLLCPSERNGFGLMKGSGVIGLHVFLIVGMFLLLLCWKNKTQKRHKTRLK